MRQDGGRSGRRAGWFANRGVATKVLTSVLIGAVAMGAVMALALSRLGSLHETGHRMHEEALIPVIQLDEVRRAFLQTRLDAFADQLTAKNAESDEHQAFLRDVQDMEAGLAAYAANNLDADEEAALAELTDAWNSFKDVVANQLTPLGWAEGNSEAFRALRNGTVKPLAQRIQAALNTLVASAEQRVAEQVAANESVYTSGRNALLAAGGGGIALSILLALVVARMIVDPVRRVSQVLDAIAEGDLTRTSDVHSRDEIGRMARSVDAATARLREMISAVADSARSLSDSGAHLTTVSERISASAGETSSQADLVAAAAQQITVNVQTAATGAEEMGASIRDIASNATEAARVAQEAVDVAGSANSTVAELGNSSTEIGNVVKLITAIAEQTNLLALNATIEAARAGEAGKGFAVVANEVKDLAQETAKATRDISDRIQAIQGDAGQAVQAIARIGEVIARVNDYSTTIASAVEEQTATTNEMARSVSEASTGAGEIARNIGGVASAATATSTDIGESRQAAQAMAQLSDTLNDLVARFRY